MKWKNLIKTLDLEFTQGSNLSKSVREAVKDLIYLMSAGIINWKNIFAVALIQRKTDYLTEVKLWNFYQKIKTVKMKKFLMY